MIIRYTDAFLRHYRKANVRVRGAFKAQLHVFERDPADPRLHTHALHGVYAGCSSIDVSADWPAIFRWGPQTDRPGLDPVVYFLALGTHRQLYRNRAA